MSQTDINQIDILIQQKKDEIDALEDLKNDFKNEDVAEPVTAAEVAQDPDASAEERAAAATATLGQDPSKVFAEQAEPTAAEVEAEEDANKSADEVEQEQEEQAQQDEETRENAEENDKVSAPASEAQGVEIPSGRGNPNDLVDQVQQVTPGEEQQAQASAQGSEIVSEDDSSTASSQEAQIEENQENAEDSSSDDADTASSSDSPSTKKSRKRSKKS